jgi:hypothetical protein
LQKLRIFQSAKTTFEYIALSLAPQAGMPVHTLTTPSLADGLTVPTVGINAFATGAPLIDKVMRQYFLCLVLCVHPLISVVLYSYLEQQAKREVG